MSRKIRTTKKPVPPSKSPGKKLSTKKSSPHEKFVQQPVGQMKGRSALSPSPVRNLKLPKNYFEVLHELKDRIRSAQLRASLAMNQELILLYHDIGRKLAEQEQRAGWGDNVVEQLAQDLRQAFPGMRGFSRTNLFYMRQFYLAYPEEEFVQQLVGQIPWGHNLIIISRLKDHTHREFYVRECIKNGWSRNVLLHQIDSDLFSRQGGAITNFPQTLPPRQSELALQTLKDSYVLDFLELAEETQERKLERALLQHLRDFLVELGKGFAFVGSQYHLEVSRKDFYLDLLFYHLHLRCFVVIDVKLGEFQPEYAGKMNFYLSAVDRILRRPGDQPSIGIILCKKKDRIIAEYALCDLKKPMGVATYKLTRSLPQNLKHGLPSIQELEKELGKKGRAR